ncbi:MAG TPA: BatD family protein, partial [Bacteroidales bacterium]|nr:BatD family protein [Bacteroidales bacterium]
YFKGAVGNFNITAKLSADSVRVNDAITLAVTINGAGNLKLIEAPPLTFPKEFEVYEPQISLNLSKTEGETRGSKTYEYTIIPRFPGNYQTGEIRFAFFDPATASYKTQKTENFVINVYRMPGDTAGQFSSNYSRSQIEYIGNEDILFIKTNDFAPRKGLRLLVDSWLFYVLTAVPLAILLGVILLLRKRIKEAANMAYVKNKRANKTTMRRLKKAAVFMQQNNNEAFFKEVLNALWGYISDKLAIQVADLNKDTVIDLLNNKGVEPDLTQQFIELIEECEMAHFAPINATGHVSNVYERATETINQFEQKLKQL